MVTKNLSMRAALFLVLVVVARTASGFHCHPAPGHLRTQLRATPAGDPEIDQARAVLVRAAVSKDVAPEEVYEAIRLREKQTRRKGEREKAEPVFEKVCGNWKLILTTGDVKTQEKLGAKINYVPVKAVQQFNEDMTITNGVYLGSFPLLKFSGSYTWEEVPKRLNFVFDKVSVLGLTLDYNQGEPKPGKVKPGFTFFDVTSDYIIARGAGGGLALWLRVSEV
jgi:hypothetical protein